MRRFHVTATIHEGAEAQVDEVIGKEFAPAIARRRGFRGMFYGRSGDGGRGLVLDLDFDTEDDRTKWVQSPEHGEIWPRLSALIDGVAGLGCDSVVEQTPA